MSETSAWPLIRDKLTTPVPPRSIAGQNARRKPPKGNLADSQSAALQSAVICEGAWPTDTTEGQPGAAMSE